VVVKALACELPSCRPEAPAALVESEGEELCLRLPGLVHAALPGRDLGSPPDAHGGEDLDAGVPGVDVQRDSRVRRQWSVQVVDPAFEHGEELEKPRSTGRGLQVGPALAAVVHVVQVELSKTAANLARTSGCVPRRLGRSIRARRRGAGVVGRILFGPVGAVVGRLGGVGDRGGGDGAVDGDLDVERRGRARPRVRPLHVTTPAANRPGASAATNEVPAGSCPSPPTPVAVHGSRCEG